jgi:hypothetical protein
MRYVQFRHRRAAPPGDIYPASPELAPIGESDRPPESPLHRMLDDVLDPVRANHRTIRAYADIRQPFEELLRDRFVRAPADAKD